MMKIIVGFFCVLFLAIGISEAQAQSEQLIGSWKISDDIKDRPFGSKYSAEEKENELIIKQFERLQKSVESRVYNFSQDGTFNIEWKYDKTQFLEEGKWYLEEGDRLQLYSKEVHLTYKVQYLENKSILMIPIGQDKGLVKRFVLIKQ